MRRAPCSRLPASHRPDGSRRGVRLAGRLRAAEAFDEALSPHKQKGEASPRPRECVPCWANSALEHPCESTRDRRRASENLPCETSDRAAPRLSVACQLILYKRVNVSPIAQRRVPLWARFCPSQGTVVDYVGRLDKLGVTGSSPVPPISASRAPSLRAIRVIVAGLARIVRADRRPS
jgi:hypothetical protein